ncbi:MAG: rane protein of unknown function [Klenkia sp.]|nr:rane protein of unknown function [Klenkia sp.]
MTSRSLAALAGALGLLALGLSWGAGPGAAHPARVAVVAALALTLLALRTGRDRLLLGAAAAGGVGIVLGGLDATPGRVALLGAVVLLLAAHRRTTAATPA